MNPISGMSMGDRKELNEDLNSSSQHCERCGKVKTIVDYCIIQGYKYLCNKSLEEVTDN